MTFTECGYQEAILKKGKQEEELEVSQIAQERDWKSGVSGLIYSWTELLARYVNIIFKHTF